MGSRGPIGKRDAERRRVNDVGTVHVEVDEAEIDEIYAEGAWAYEIGIDEDGVPLPDDDWHRIARMWYCSLKRSVQSRYYQSSDWAVAYLLAESLSRDLKPRPLIVDGEAVVDDDGNPRYVTTSINGSSMNAYLKGMTSLLVTEGDRLRVRLEINVNRSQQGTPNAPIDPEDRKLQLLA